MICEKFKRILVVGGAGFLGRNLVEALVSQGVPVRVLDRVKPQWVDSSIEFIEGDFTATHLLEKVMNDCDVVFHLASTTLPKTSNDDPQFDISTNLLGTVALLELAVEKNIKKFIYISSGGTVYGVPSTLPVAEDHPTNPTCSYGIVKLATEKYLRLFNLQYGLHTCSLRLANPFGKYQRVDTSQGAITVFCDKALRGEPIEVWGDGSIVRDYLYIVDTVQAMLKALEVDCAGQEINIGSGQGKSLNQIIECLQDNLKKNININYSSARFFDVPEIVLDIDKAKDILKWQPEVSFSDGIIHTLAWMKEGVFNGQ